MAKKKAAAKPRKAAPRAKPEPRSSPSRSAAGLAVAIDYPQEGESVLAGSYSVRVSASGADSVQVRVGDGDWADCRESIGFFWYDWSPQPGLARLSARARVGQGEWSLSSDREISVS